MDSNETWKSRTLVVGLIVGALAGLGAAYILVQRAEREGRTPDMTPGEGVKLGMMLLGMIRQIGQLGE